jgi:hypothetical protein
MPILQTGCVGHNDGTVQLSDWSVREVDTGNQYFIGFNLATGEACVSSRIVAQLPRELAGVAESGRRFELVGNPNPNPDADFLWREFLLHSGVTGWRDVTLAFRSAGEAPR